jgi:hypothetical protein
MLYLLEGTCTTSDHSLEAAVSCMLCARNLKFNEHDKKRIRLRYILRAGRRNHNHIVSLLTTYDQVSY